MSKYIRRKIIRECLIWIVIFTVAIIAIFTLSVILLSDRVYYGYEPMYPFYHWANDNRAFLVFIALSFGYFFIILIHFRKLLRYTDEILGSMEKIYDKDDELIVLSGDLKEINDYMNRIKLNLRRNEEIARDSEKRKDDLIVYLAHDLKTPLTSILGYLNILKEEDDLSERFKNKYLQVCYDKALRLEDLINEFFDITRYNLKDIVLEKTKVNFTFMMEQIIYEFKPLLKEKNLSIHSVIEPEIILSIDVKKVERVIDNIIRNAINYSYRDSIIDILVKKDNSNFVNIHIINKGPTIPNEKLSNIFDEFFRVDASRSTKTGSTGLGLAIAKSIVLAHNGTIEAKSSNDTTEMIVKLPILK